MVFLHSVEPLALEGMLPNGSFMLYDSIKMQRLRQLTSCPRSWRPEVNATSPQQSFQSLVDGHRSPEFCILGRPRFVEVIQNTPPSSITNKCTDILRYTHT